MCTNLWHFAGTTRNSQANLATSANELNSDSYSLHYIIMIERTAKIYQHENLLRELFST